MIIRAFLIGIVWACVTTVAYSAEISLGVKDDCTIVLTGEIAAGDYRNVLTISEEKGWTKDEKFVVESETYNRVLCLDSLGGSFAEGRRISNLIFEAGIGTKVKAGSGCFSACALVFMAGKNRGDEVDGPHRMLNVHAILGFHAAYLDLDESKTFTAADVAEFFKLNGLLIADLLRFSSYHSVFSAEPMISRSLIADLLTYEKDEMLIVKTVEDAARWGITLEGTKPRWKLNDRMLIQSCENFQNWASDSPSVEIDFTTNSYPQIESKKLKGGDVTKVFSKIDTGGMADRYCLISVEEGDTETYLEVCSRNDFNGVHHGGCPDYGFILPAYYALAPHTRIIDLAE